jgi:hypothetical protein
MTLKAQAAKGKINFIKIKNFCVSKDTTMETKNNLQRGRINANDRSDRIYS